MLLVLLVMWPALIRKPLFALSMEIALYLKAADVTQLAIIGVQVQRKRRLAPTAFKVIKISLTLKLFRMLLPAVAQVPVVRVAWVLFVMMHGWYFKSEKLAENPIYSFTR